MIRKEILDTAKSLICGDRAKLYGSPEVMFEQISNFWAAYDGHEATPVDAALKMALMKIARIQKGQHDPDSFVDACGYIALAGEMAANAEMIKNDAVLKARETA